MSVISCGQIRTSPLSLKRLTAFDKMVQFESSFEAHFIDETVELKQYQNT